MLLPLKDLDPSDLPETLQAFDVAAGAHRHPGRFKLITTDPTLMLVHWGGAVFIIGAVVDATEGVGVGSPGLLGAIIIDEEEVLLDLLPLTDGFPESQPLLRQVAIIHFLFLGVFTVLIDQIQCFYGKVLVMCVIRL